MIPSTQQPKATRVEKEDCCVDGKKRYLNQEQRSTIVTLSYKGTGKNVLWIQLPTGMGRTRYSYRSKPKLTSSSKPVFTRGLPSMSRSLIHRFISSGLKLYVKITTGLCKSKKRLDGKTVIVTGANTGIGKETARDLAQRGAKVILGCRDLEKGKKACDEIIASTGNTNVEVQHLDLSSLASVRKFARNIIDTESRLDVLVNNAGATRVERMLTEDGLLLGMQANHFGPFLLTCLLVGLLKRSSPSRIVIVASELHRVGTLDMDNLNSVDAYGGDRVYCNSKLANVLMSNELARKLEGTGIINGKTAGSTNLVQKII